MIIRDTEYEYIDYNWCYNGVPYYRRVSDMRVILPSDASNWTKLERLRAERICDEQDSLSEDDGNCRGCGLAKCQCEVFDDPDYLEMIYENDLPPYESTDD